MTLGNRERANALIPPLRFADGAWMPDSKHDLDRVLGVPLEIRVELARKSVTIAELLAAAPGQIVMLDRLADDDVDVYAADQLLGQGEVVVVDEEFGVRLTALYERSDDASGDDEPPEMGRASWGSPTEPVA